MKKIFGSAIICLLAAAAGGCQHNERELYDTGYTALNIWLGSQQHPVERTIYNFITHEDMDQVTFFVRISGVAADYDRPFTLEAVAGHIDKVEFQTEEYVIPKGEYSASFPIYFRKPENYSEFRYGDGYIVFKIKSDHFEQGATGNANNIPLNRLYFVLQNGVSKPYNWDSDTWPFQPGGLGYYFGSYSDTKYEFMINTLGISDFRVFVASTGIEDYPDENIYTNVEVNFFVTKCRNALALYNADPDNIASGRAPLTDEFNFPVTF